MCMNLNIMGIMSTGSLFFYLSSFCCFCFCQFAKLKGGFQGWFSNSIFIEDASLDFDLAYTRVGKNLIPSKLSLTHSCVPLFM